MKPSHLQTPRTLQDCVLIPSADPIERPNETPAVIKWYVAALVIAAIAVIGWRLM